MKLPATTAILLSLLPRTLASFSSSISHRFPTSTTTCTRSAVSMVSSTISDNANNSDRIYKPVHIYPYSSDLSVIKATDNYAKLKRFHIIRHAEGTHNVNREYKAIINLDARLTDLGKAQCKNLAEKLVQAQTKGAKATPGNSVFDEADSHRQILQKTDLVVTSPLTRCLQTALLSFPTLANASNDDTASSSPTNNIPFVAHESIRETVNYACDRRRPISELEPHYHEKVCFRAIEHDHDELWEASVRRLGSSDEYDKHRESAELHAVADRARDFLAWVSERPEQEIVVCTHSAFLRCILSWGQAGGVPMMMSQALDGRGGGAAAIGGTHEEVFMTQDLDDREEANRKEVPVFQYCGDEAFEEYMRGDYENCELRSFVAAFP